MAYSNHRYDTADYKRVDPMLGTDDDFRCLCEECHKHGMKLIIDGVFSHTGSDSVYFDAKHRFGGGAISDPDGSRYKSWFNFKHYPDEYESWWGIATLPCVNELNEDYLDYIIRDEDSVVAHWMNLGADGFRLDVVDEIPDEFLALLRHRVKELNPDSIIIGEVWEDASNKISYGKRRTYFTAAELDSTMNYPFRTAIIDYATGAANAEAFENSVMNILENYPPEVIGCLMNSLSTHDTPRILTLLSGVTYTTRDERASAVLSGADRENAMARTKLAVALQFTLPGNPAIYYGDEIGMEGYEDPFNRRYFRWDNVDHELASFYRKAAKLKEHPAVKAVRTDFICYGGLLHMRRYSDDTCIHVVANNTQCSVPVPKKANVLMSARYDGIALAPCGWYIYEDEIQ